MRGTTQIWNQGKWLSSFIKKLTLISICQAVSLSAIAGVSDGFESAYKPMPAQISPYALRAQMLGISAKGSAIVAVGEHGVILRSDDGGLKWKQMPSPIDVTLTSVAFVSDKKVIVVGHGGVILQSGDSGLNWSIKNYEPKNNKYYLIVKFINDSRGYITGTDGEVLTSNDGGESWERSVLTSADGMQGHIFGITESSSRMVAVGEKGAVFVSKNRGGSWQQMESPYAGSFFGVTPLTADRYLIYGMRGRAYILQFQTDMKSIWSEIKTDSTQFFLDAAVTDNGHSIIVGRGGTLIELDASGNILHKLEQTNKAEINAIMVKGDNAFLLTSKGGVERKVLKDIFLEK